MKLKPILLMTSILIIFIWGIAFAEEWSPAQKEVWKMQEAYFDASSVARILLEAVVLYF